MDTIYRIGVIGRSGMYCCGDNASSPELAKMNRGVMVVRAGDRLGVFARRRLPGTWTDSCGMVHERYTDAVLVEAESVPREWGIV